ncbi:MAG: PKD-like family lipoprotein [Candidatus Pseudobacter hemicellulosilyticus]|uniref:PKD-like family lipoprotein n=1 Tax=Candidatus Pseudobacter hemicellulosilyticus TaxID=3121375 RepID=A0AAJ6BIQ5_9BACT|nr:MAG: PKD-like family lipoprotein [Pseudobacter sp.]
MKTFFYSILFVWQCCCLLSCYKDKGNYAYQDINEISFSNIDTTAGYAVFIGDTLSIAPVLNSSQSGKEANYTYEWSFFDNIKGDRILSTDKNLKIRIAENPGSYSLQYRVTDKSTGVLFHVRTNVLVRTSIYEGYMVLNEVNGKSRLDMLSYDATNGSFTQLTDVLARMGSSLPEQGAPIKVVCTRVSNAFNWSDSTYGIYLLTATGTNRIHPETFDWRPIYDIRYEIAGDIPADFKADNLIPDPAFYYVTIFLSSGNNAYLRSGPNPMYSLPVNKFLGQEPFKASPYMTSTSSQYLMMYDIEKRSFAMLSDHSSFTAQPAPVADDPGEIPYPSGRDLLFMQKTATGYAYAITRTPGGTDCYLTKFIPGALPVYSRKINGTDIDKAANFAMGATPEYLFYSVGGKLYEYDLYLESSKLMLDKGGLPITYLAFQPFSANRNPALYGQWARWLTVGFADPSGEAGANGTLEQYSVPDANEALVLQKKWTGFGTIKSVSYRER